MLKGLKKKLIGEDKEKSIQQKSEPINQEKKGSQSQEERLIKMNAEALQMFMKGKVVELQAKLEEIRKEENFLFERNQLNVPGGSEDTKKEKSKFEYTMNFEEEEDENQGKGKGKGRKKHIPRVKAERTIDYCHYCPQNQELYLLSASNFVYLAMPKLKTFRKYHHFIIAPVQHQQTRIGLDSDIEDELRNYQKCLIQMFEKINLHAIFLEQYSSNNSHIYIECLGIPLKKAYDLPFFFKQALENVEGNWTSHKNVIDIRKQKGGLLKQIPKQIKYCYIDFGLGYGYAHVIENQKFWQRGFLHEVVASALSLQSYHVKTTEQYFQQQLQQKAKQFDKMWKEFDWTNLLDPNNKQKD